VLVVAGMLVMSGSAIAQGAAPVTLDFAGTTTWLGQAPIMAAIDKGYFKDEGITVNFQSILASSDRMAALNSGAVAFSNLGRGAVLAAMARGNKSFYYFGNIDQAPGQEGCWAGPGINSFQDLKGKPVAANTSAELTLNGLLAASHMPRSDIQYMELPPNEMVVALSKRDVDAVCVWEPFLGKAKAAVPNGKLLGTDMDTATYKKYGTVASADLLIISRKLVDEHPDVAKKLAAAIFKGVDYINKSPDDAAKTIAHYFGQPPEVVLDEMKKFKYVGGQGAQQHLAGQEQQLQEMARQLYDSKKIPNLPDVKAWSNGNILPTS
jgi:NitT/TauT family transport system substrate-binding protein